MGTAEELLYLLGILMNPANKDQVLPLILTGPKGADYFRVLDEFVVHTLVKTRAAITASSLMTPLKSLVR